MSKRIAVLTLAIAVVASLSACAPVAAPTPTPDAMMAITPMMADTPQAMMEKTPDTMMVATPDAMMSQEAMTDTLMTATPDAMMAQGTMTDTMMAMPPWFSASFTAATNGTTFKVQDFKDKVVLVEMMAIECPACLQQQNEIKVLREQLGLHDDLVVLSIDVNLNENLAGLKDYAAKNGYDWLHTVASATVVREIGDRYGAQFLNPPSTAMLIVDKHGEAHPLPFGMKTAADLQKVLEPYLSDGM